MTEDLFHIPVLTEPNMESFQWFHNIKQNETEQWWQFNNKILFDKVTSPHLSGIMMRSMNIFRRKHLSLSQLKTLKQIKMIKFPLWQKD